MVGQMLLAVSDEMVPEDSMLGCIVDDNVACHANSTLIVHATRNG